MPTPNYTLNPPDRSEFDDSKPWDSASLGTAEGSAPVALVNTQTKAKDDPLSQENLKRFFEAMFVAADEHRKPRELIWDQCWNLYNNQFDFSDRAWWQHKAPIPKVRTSVDKAVAIFRKTLLRLNPFYGIQAESKLGRSKGRFTMLLTDYWYDQSDIMEVLIDAFRVGLVTSTAILKIWWMRARSFKPEVSISIQEVPTYEFGVQTGSYNQTTRSTKLVDQWRGKLGVAVVNPRNFWIVPGTHGRCVIERSEATLNEIEAMVKSPKNPEGIYSKDAVEELRYKLSTRVISQDTNPETTGEGAPGANDYLKMVDLWHYWGDIYDTDGKLVKPDASFTLANRDLLIREARDNPFFHRTPPYVIGSPYKIPFSTYNRGMVEDVLEIAKTITNLTNLIADGALYDALKCFSLDIDQLDNTEEAKTGVYPGKTFIRKSSQATAPNENLVQTVQVGHVPQEAMSTISMMEKYYAEGTYLNEWVEGQGGKGSRTLGEVNIKTQSALEGLDESARNLEITLIEPMLQMTAETIYQFHEEYNLTRLMDNYPNIALALQQLTPAERYSIMVGDFSFKVRGLSVMIDREQRIGELKEILQLLSYLPGFLERLNPDATLEEILMPLGWDPSKLLLNPAASSVTTPAPGAPPPMPPMALPPGAQPAMQVRNAAEGRRMGGGRNNPMARGRVTPISQPQGAGGPPQVPAPIPQGAPNPMAQQIARMVQFAMMKQFANRAAQPGSMMAGMQ